MKKPVVLKALILAVLLAPWTVPAFAQVDTAWVRHYNGPEDTTDGATAIAVDHSGNVYVVGGSYGIGTCEDYATIKYYPNGDTAWARRYNGPGDTTDAPVAIAVDDSGNVYVTGWSQLSATDWDYATVKYHPYGDTAWVRRYNGPGNSYDIAWAIDLDDSGNIYVTGWSYGSETLVDYLTIKYYTDGDTAWVRRYNGAINFFDGAYAITVDDSNNVYVTGFSAGSGTSEDYATIKYYPNGDTAWVRRYNGPGNDEDFGRAITVDALQNVYVTGFSYGSGTSKDYATIKYYPNGDTAWVRRYNGPADSTDEAKAIAIDASGNVYVTGFSFGSGTYEDYATIKYYANGDTAWVRRYNGPADSTDEVSAISLDSSNNVYVTGRSYDRTTDYDCATIKYDTSGNELWAERYNGPGDSTDAANAIAVGHSGNVYVAGASYCIGTCADYTTIKYVQEEVFAEEENRQDMVSSFLLFQNYPNPFNPQTVIGYRLNSPAEVNLKIYNIKGQLVRTLTDGHRHKGFHQISWDGKDEKGKKTSSGIYFYQIRAKDRVEAKKMVKLK